MDVKSKLSEIVGAENFSDDPAQLQAYATDFSYTPAGAPNYVVKPASSEEVAEVIKFCNENNIPVVPCSSKVHFYGATIPKEGGVVLDMSENGQNPGNRSRQPAGQVRGRGHLGEANDGTEKDRVTG